MEQFQVILIIAFALCAIAEFVLFAMAIGPSVKYSQIEKRVMKKQLQREEYDQETYEFYGLVAGLQHFKVKETFCFYLELIYVDYEDPDDTTIKSWTWTRAIAGIFYIVLALFIQMSLGWALLGFVIFFGRTAPFFTDYMKSGWRL